MIGFQSGLMQQALQTEFQMKLPARPNFERIDALISLILGDQLETPDRASAGGEPREGEVAFAHAGRVLRLASGLRRLAQFPIFSDGRVLDLSEDSTRASTYQVKAIVPQLDYFPVSILKESLMVADAVVRWASVNEDALKSPDSAYTLIQKRIILRAKRFLTSGVSTMPILRAAYAQGTPFLHLGNDTYFVGMGSNGRVISRSSVDTDSIIGSQTACLKDRTARLLRIAGLPAPHHRLVSTREEALEAAAQVGWPVVVKPSDRERSEGVKTGLKDLSAVEEAFAAAQTFSKNILVERHVPGVCFRLMVANKKFLYAVERRPRSVVGDGNSSVRDLLLADNARNAQLPPWFQKKTLAINDETISAIEAQGFHLDSVPSEGTRVGLMSIESSEWGEMTFDVTSQVAPENIEVAERAAAVLGLDNAGVDMISTDISRPWSEVGAVINEVNFRPHFGGTAAAKSRMQFYVDNLVRNKGLIPVEVYVGDERALQAASTRQASLIQSGLRACLTSHALTLDATGKPRQFAGANNLLDRSCALLVDKTVDAIILVIQTGELLQLGIPVPRVSKINVINHHLSLAHSPGQLMSRDDVDRIIAALHAVQA